MENVSTNRITRSGRRTGHHRRIRLHRGVAARHHRRRRNRRCQRGRGLDGFNASVEALVADASAEQTQVPPTEGPALVEGASVFIIPCAMVAQGCADSALAAQEAAEAVGWDVTFIDPAGDPTAMNNAVTQAISQGADAIITTAIDGPTIAGSLAQARRGRTRLGLLLVLRPQGLYDSGYPAQKVNYDHGYLAMASLYERTGRDLKVVMVNGPDTASPRSPTVAKTAGGPSSRSARPPAAAVSWSRRPTS